MQQAIQQVVGPLALGPGALAQVSLAAHAQLFQHGGRCRVPRIAAGADPVLAPRGEQVPHQQARRFGGVAVPLMPGGYRESDLALAGILGVRFGRAVTDQPAGRAQRHRELEPFPGGVGVLLHLLPNETLTLVPRIRRVPALEPGHLGTGAVRHELRQIVQAEPAQHHPVPGQLGEVLIGHDPSLPRAACPGHPGQLTQHPQGAYARVMRLVSLLPSATEIVYALGLGDQLAGVTFECDEPASARAEKTIVVGGLDTRGMTPREIDAYVHGRLAAGGDLYTLHERALAELQPDLILTQDLCRVCALPSGQVEAALDYLGCRARVLTLDPRSLEEVLDSIQAVGQATGVPGQAGRLVAGLRARLAQVAGRGA